ncbi:YozE family protein [Aureibacillus halotolerans]|uniref:UPF0346 protein EV213_10324 n=1 Tax=Aureibacillus halotolerans TaxID=1508390 RepID=A0A4V3D5U7_9BACI|nr:YozE family protein [Aureibacillus halotolerans]TDQ41447.1 uncharacterized protein YozE (UPF0346 family) [Aureibacillus halotolerans]
MKKSFYHYAMKYRQHKGRDAYARFAEELYQDQLFPRQSVEYEEISHYLEHYAPSLDSVRLFDELWSRYEQEEV